MREFIEDFEIQDDVLRKHKDTGGQVVNPGSVASIGNHAFSGCESLAGFQKAGCCKRIDGHWYSEDGKTLVQYVGRPREASFRIPDGVTGIGDHAFSGCRSLTGITIPDSVTSIGDRAFSRCASLTSITIPDGVTSIGYHAFSGCASLTDITIPDSVMCIGAYAFSGCSRLTSITISDNVTSIGDWAFSGCTGLTDLQVADKNGYYKEIDGHLYSKDGKTLIQYVGGSREASFIIPDGVTRIGNGAFSGCRSLTGITIPDSVTSIGEDAFFGCESLTGITIPDSVTSIGEDAFWDCNTTIHATEGSYAEKYAKEEDLPFAAVD